MEGEGIAREGGATREQRWVQRTSGRPYRAASERAMVFALPEDDGSARGRARSFDSILSRALGESLRAMDREHSGLVHQPSDLVGPSYSRLVPETQERGRETGERRDVVREGAAL